MHRTCSHPTRCRYVRRTRTRNRKTAVGSRRLSGALNYIRTDGTTIESWEASGSEHSPGLLYSTHSGSRFNTDAALPVDTIARAVREFAESGTRPTCVTWRQGTLV
ncbi:Imm1 family immunity protein [Actinopolyspora lacussalsi]|uniref:Imm1 family immunity protein n=1 Tax=Actinopolyspora righensis TaxID=995060 RepID=UPI000B85F99D